MSILRSFITPIFLLAGLQAAVAEPYGIGSGPQGNASYHMATAIAAVAGKKENLDIRVEPHGGTAQYIPAINAGELEFGFANSLELTYATKGTGTFKGRANPNLRLVGATYPFMVTPLVPADSDIRKISDLKGRRYPTGYNSAPIIQVLTNALLANGGLTVDDLVAVPVPTARRGAEIFMTGEVDASAGVVGTGSTTRIDAALGGIRFLPIDDSPAAMAALRRHMPTAYVRVVEPGPGMTGIVEPTKVMAYDFFVFANADVPDEVVYSLTKALYENKAELAATISAFRFFEPNQMAKDIGLKFHPGAIKFYQDRSIWRPKS